MKLLSSNMATPTKLRAMSSSFLTKEDLIYLSKSEDFNEVINKLDELKAYHLLFKDISLGKSNRQELEKILYLRLLYDYAKLFKFVSGNYKSFLKLYFVHFELQLLKRSVREVLVDQKVSKIEEVFKPYFEKYSKVDFVKLEQTTDIQSFIDALKGTIYYEELSKLKENAGLFDYELCLDLVYFKHLFKNKSRFLSKEEEKELDQIIGSNIDLLNIEWIYRSKKYYHLDNVGVYSILIPKYYRLKPSHIKSLVEATNLEEFKAAFNQTYYGKEKRKHFQNIDSLETFNDKFIYHIFIKNIKKDPISVVSLYAYFFKREFEIKILIHIIESVNYKVPNYDIESALI